MELLEARKHKMLNVLIEVKDVTRTEIGKKTSPPVSRQAASFTVLGITRSPRVRASIIRELGLPDDFFSADYEMTINLKKKDSQAA
ncbi:hypothetical protein M0R72_06350 [Candidatus Pacearchaeota archaeon]|nr:hypothetical protein [Candidatus Pacearchaeota archaeon]